MIELKVACGDGQTVSRQISEGERVVVGRDGGCDVILADDSVSRRHAAFSLKNGQLDIEDLGSSNGTWVNGQKITKRAWVPGESLALGGCQATIEGAGAASLTMPLSQAATIAVPKAIRNVLRGQDSPPSPAGASAAPQSFQSLPSGQGSATPANDPTGPAFAAQRGNFITRHWRGGYSLGRSILINTSLIWFLWMTLEANVLDIRWLDAGPATKRYALALQVLVSIALLTWMGVGSFWSAWYGKARGAWLGSRVLGYMSTLGTISIAFMMLSSLVLVWDALRDAERPMTVNGQPQFQLRVEGNLLYVSGSIVVPLLNAVRQELQRNPNVNAVVLVSGGGDTYTGRRLADLMWSRNLTTVTNGLCASACTYIFAGGRQRAITPNGRLGYHAAAFIAGDDMMTRIMNMFTFRQDRLAAAVYRRAGMSEPFIQRALSTPSVDLWVPTHDVLQQNGAITRRLQ